MTPTAADELSVAHPYGSAPQDSVVLPAGLPAVPGSRRHVDAVVVGAGFAGMYQLHRLHELGLDVQVFEAADDVGGVWYWNRYPGARCDIESIQYSYSFSPELEQDWTWTERYASQPEILSYANHVADRFDLRRHVQFGTRVVSAHWNHHENCWLVSTDDGVTTSATFCIMATGCLSVSKSPEIAGLASYSGDYYHTGSWPHEGVDFSGKRVAVIGTGSSATQSIPLIAAQAEHLFVLQRTANYSVPAHNRHLDPAEVAAVKARYPQLRAEARATRAGIAAPPGEPSVLAVPEPQRTAFFEASWQRGGLPFVATFLDLVRSEQANEVVAAFMQHKIRSAVRDPDVAQALLPRTYPFGTKRLCVDTGYYDTYNRDNVTLVDLRSTPLQAITDQGLRTTQTDIVVDAIVFATGFDAMTGALARIDIRGQHGKKLADKWAAGPRTYLGVATAGFPNLFTITGPGSPSVLTNMFVAIEQHVEWISDCIEHLRNHGLKTVAATVEAEEAWTEHVNDMARETLFPQADSWYMGANVPGKPRVFMPYLGGSAVFRSTCTEVASSGYRGFVMH